MAKVNGVYLCDGITLFETCDSNSEWPSEGLKERVRTLVTFVTMPQWRGEEVMCSGVETIVPATK